MDESYARCWEGSVIPVTGLARHLVIPRSAATRDLAGPSSSPAGPRLLVHSDAGIAHGQHGVLTLRHRRVGRHGLAPQIDSRRLDDDPPTPGHGIPGVDREVRDDLLELPGIDRDGQWLLAQGGDQLDILPAAG